MGGIQSQWEAKPGKSFACIQRRVRKVPRPTLQNANTPRAGGRFFGQLWPFLRGAGASPLNRAVCNCLNSLQTVVCMKMGSFRFECQKKEIWAEISGMPEPSSKAPRGYAMIEVPYQYRAVASFSRQLLPITGAIKRKMGYKIARSLRSLTAKAKRVKQQTVTRPDAIVLRSPGNTEACVAAPEDGDAPVASGGTGVARPADPGTATKDTDMSGVWAGWVVCG